jgi:hypothetical protein
MWEHGIGTYQMVSAKIGFSCASHALHSRMCQSEND